MIHLSTTEIQIVELVCMELTNKMIAKKLHYSEKSIEYHLRNIAEKLKVKSKIGIVAKVYQYNLMGGA